MHSSNLWLLSYSKDGEEEEEETNENEDEEDGETRQRKEEISGPWNKSTQPQSAQPGLYQVPGINQHGHNRNNQVYIGSL